jgi:acyl-CoA thioester hydrolase
MLETCPKTFLPLAPLVAFEPHWMDYNGHLNMAYYAVIMDRGLDVMFDLLGLGESYITTRGFTFFTCDFMLRYRKEVRASDHVQARMRLLGVDDKRLHYAAEIVSAEDMTVHAFGEGLCLHVDFDKRRVAPFPPDTKAVLERIVADHSKAGWPELAGHRIGLPQKT